MATELIHTMVRVNNLEESIKFYTEILGMKVNKNTDYESGRFTLVFLGYGEIENSHQIELTYNWDQNSYDHGDAYGHIALRVDDIYDFCEKAKAKGAKITREPGGMKFAAKGAGSEIAFLEDPNGYKIELIQRSKS